MYNKKQTSMVEKKKKKRASPSEDTKRKISAGVKKYHKKCRDNAAKLAKLTKTTGKKKYFS